MNQNDFSDGMSGGLVNTPQGFLAFVPNMTIGRATKVLGKTHPTAKAAITVLEQNNILKEATGRQWGWVYVCSPVLDAIDKPFA